MLVGEYQVLGSIGRGGYGTVYRCANIKTGQVRAIKISTDVNDLDEALRLSSTQSEWDIYRQLEFGRGTAAGHGIPEVYETGTQQLNWLDRISIEPDEVISIITVAN